MARNLVKRFYHRAGSALVVIIPAVFYLSLFGCTGGKGGGEVKLKRLSGGTIRLEGKGIAVEVRREMTYRVFCRERDGWSTIVSDRSVPEADVPIVGGKELGGFKLSTAPSGLESVETPYGPGLTAVWSGTATSPDGIRLEKRLEVTFVSGLESVALFRVIYHNPGDRPVTLDGYVQNRLVLDRSLSAPTAEKWDFWSFQGGGILTEQPGYTRRISVFPLRPGFSQDNNTEKWGGTPLVDIWGKETGIALGCVEPRPKIIRLPVRVESDGRVSLSVKRMIPRKIPPRGIMETVYTALMVHHLDYFHGLRKYAAVMKRIGFNPKPCPDFGYDPFWCDWGYRRNWKPANHFDRLDILKDLGITVQTVDDGWFYDYGDWEVNREKFPEGEKGFKQFVEKLHREGFKVVLWWVPGIAGPKLAKKHPEWLIRDRDGKPVKTPWPGSYHLCPTLPQVREYTRRLVDKFVVEWGFDGFKLDGVYTCPPCYNRLQRHRPAEASTEAYPDLFRVIYERVQKARPGGDFILGFCPCGHFANFWCLNWINRPVTADPPGRNLTTRRRIRAYKALLGPYSAVDNDFHETYNDYFPAEITAGGIPSTKFTILSDYELSEFKKWYEIYRKTRLSAGKYLALYDIAYDKPETYSISRGDTLYYAMFTENAKGLDNLPWDAGSVAKRKKMMSEFWEGISRRKPARYDIELRGLKPNAVYRVVDYENGRELFRGKAPIVIEDVPIRDHLLLRAEPIR